MFLFGPESGMIWSRPNEGLLTRHGVTCGQMLGPSTLGKGRCGSRKWKRLLGSMLDTLKLSFLAVKAEVSGA